MIDLKTDRRNFKLGVANGLLYITAETLMDPTLVMVAFLSHLTQSPLLLGLVLPIRDGAWSLPQLYVSGYLQNIPHKLTIYRSVSILRVATWITLALIINLVHNPKTLLILYFVTFAISSIASGFSGLPFLEVVGKTIPPERRGEFFAWRFGLGGLGSLAASGVVRWLLDPGAPLSFPYNYGMLSILFVVLSIASAVAFCMINEPVDRVVLPRQAFSVQIKRALRAVQENLRYRSLLSMQALMIIGGSAAPFYAVFVQQDLGGSPAMIGAYLATLTATNLLANAWFGRISRKYGNARVMFFGVSAGICMALLVLTLALLGKPAHFSPELASAWLVPVFILSGIRGSAMGVSSNSLLLDITPEAERSLYVGFSNTLLGAVLLMTGISGVLVNWFGVPALLIITLAAHLIAMVVGKTIIRPPAG